MAEPVLMPKQGQSVESCIITEWMKTKGDKIEKGDVLFAYETDKASFEEEAKKDGVLLEIFFNAGDEVPVLTNVAVIGGEGESVDEFRPGNRAPEKKADQPPEKEHEEVKASTDDERNIQTAGQARGDKIRISPRARRLALDKGVKFEELEGSGPNGRIIVRDVEKALTNAATPTSSPYSNLGSGEYTGSEYEDTELSNIRKLISRSMHNSLQNSAQLTHHLSADARKILTLRQRVKNKQKEGYSYNITLNDMICFAALKSLKKNPEANAHFLGDKIRKFQKIHLGMAVDTERGLMVPALKNAGDLSLEGLSSQLKELAHSCRTGSVDPDLLQSTAGTFTISNLGNYGIEMFTPIINLPQVAILGVNTIIHRPAEIENGIMGFIPYLGLSLTYDHRAIDGGPASRFLASVKEEIENFNLNIL